MSSFQQVVYKRPRTSDVVSPSRSFLQLARSSSPLSIAAPQHVSSVSQTQNTPIAHCGHSFENIPLFPQQRTLSTSSSSPIQRQSIDEEPLPDEHTKTKQESEHSEQEDKDEEQTVQKMTQTAQSESLPEQQTPSTASATEGSQESRGSLAENLRVGAESLSGIAMNDVHVYYNSPKPVQVQALAYTRGSNIYLGPGQERHLPHEVWHVVQQKQGRVRPTLQAKGVAINDENALEREADVMGARMSAVQRQAIAGSIMQRVFQPHETPIQRKRLYFKPNDETKVGANIKKLDTMAGTLDKETEEAHLYVVDKLQKAEAGTYMIDKKDFASSDNRIVDWITKLGGKNNTLKSATTGYIIEDIVTDKFKGVAGYTAQHMMPGARPDFLLKDGLKRGVVDVTSTGDKGHILDKKFTISSFDYAVESLYPQINFANINTTTMAVSDATVKAGKEIRKQRAAARFVKILNELRRNLVLIMEGSDKEGVRKSAKVAEEVVWKMISSVSSSSFGDGIIKGLDKTLKVIKLKTKFALPSIKSIIRGIMLKYGVKNTPPWR